MTNEKEIPTVLKEALARMGMDSSALADNVRENPGAIDAETLRLFIIYSKIYAAAAQIGKAVHNTQKQEHVHLPVTSGFELI